MQAQAQFTGVQIRAEHGHTIKLYLNNKLQTDSFSTLLKVCCYNIDYVDAKVIVDSNIVIESPLNLRFGYFVYYSVNQHAITFESFEELPEYLQTQTVPKLLNIPDKKHTNLKDSTLFAQRNSIAQPQLELITDEQFIDFYAFINGLKFEYEQLKEAKGALKRYRFTSRHIKVIMGVFSHESTMMEFAKYAYDFVEDKPKFDIVTNALNNIINKQAMEAFISSKR
ncbi:MAG: DUF4476 domain-containing protein [Chitinophagia bacterium]|nr:DUF4476 domain-containing protein [Chitinophagia bacterium]